MRKNHRILKPKLIPLGNSIPIQMIFFLVEIGHIGPEQMWKKQRHLLNKNTSLIIFILFVAVEPYRRQWITWDRGRKTFVAVGIPSGGPDEEFVLVVQLVLTAVHTLVFHDLLAIVSTTGVFDKYKSSIHLTHRSAFNPKNSLCPISFNKSLL